MSASVPSVKATEVRERAERRLGEIMADMPKAEGAKGKPGGRGAPIVRVSSEPTQPPTLASLGIDLNGTDPLGYIVSANIHRRHMTRAQRAMALAMIAPEPEKGAPGKQVKILTGMKVAIHKARVVLKFKPGMSGRTNLSVDSLDRFVTVNTYTGMRSRR